MWSVCFSSKQMHFFSEKTKFHHHKDINKHCLNLEKFGKYNEPVYNLSPYSMCE